MAGATKLPRDGGSRALHRSHPKVTGEVKFGTEKLKAGKSTLRFEFVYDGGGFAKGGLGTLYVNDKMIGEGRINRTQPMIFSADKTADVGIDLATPVVEVIGAEARSRFNGRIPKVTVAVKP